jgi:RsiW-degrading membrane proteinase PrsW (M82 family)
MFDHWATKRLYLLMACLTVVLGLLVFGEVSGHLSPRSFAIAAACFLIGSFVGLTIFFNNVKARNQLSTPAPGSPMDAATRKRLQDGVRTLRRMVFVLPVLLVIGLWDTKDQPLWAVLGGVAVSITITTICFIGMRKAQARLKEQDQANEQRS